MNFTFGLLLYNQEKYVIETLESIKYQILNFGNNVECDLILNDDASKDNSLQLASLWLDRNKTLFHSIIINDLKRNYGTVNGQQFIVDNCKTDYYKILACDDILSSKNLFECYRSLDDKTIKSYLRLELFDGVLGFNKELFNKVFYLRSNETYIKAMRKGCFLHSPSTIYKKSLYYSAKCSELNSLFTLFEDDPTWYQMIKNTSDLKIEFNDEVIVLYRISKNSVSNSDDKNNKFRMELEKLSRIYEKDSNGIEKLFFKSKNSKLPKYMRIDRYLDYLDRKKYDKYCSDSVNYIQILNHIKQIIKHEQEYYDLIKRKADIFMQELK